MVDFVPSPVVAHLAVWHLVFGLALATVSIPIQIAEMTKGPVGESRFELILQFAAATRCAHSYTRRRVVWATTKLGLRLRGAMGVGARGA